MAYEVTATRKRPQDFDRLVGQDFVVSTLENAINEKRIAHAYLFSGPRGVGKTSSARLLAKALNCERGMSAHPCGECNSCREIASGTSVDVIEIDGASNTSVNDIRAIKEEVLFPPQSSRYKIYIIDEVHMLSTSAFNALLKTIEEPPEYIIFIFATTELQKVPATIRSRCQQFRFQLIGQNEITACLRSAAEDLSIEADEDALFWIAKESTGSMRDAYTLFDQVASFSQGHITLEKIRQKLNITGFGAIAEIVRLSLSSETKKAMEMLSDLFMSGVSAEQIIKDSAEFFRTLLFYKEGVRKPELLSVSESDIPSDIADQLDKEQLEAAFKAFLNLYRDIRYSLSPRFEVELLISRLSSLRYLSSSDRLIRKLEDMKNGIISGSIVVESKAPAIPEQKPVTAREEEKKTAEPAIAEPVEPRNEEELTLDSMKAIAQALRDDGMAEAGFYISTVTAVIPEDGSTYNLVTDKVLAYNKLSANANAISKAAGNLLEREIYIRVTLNKPKEENRDHEGLKNLQRVFGGRIIHKEENRTKEKEPEAANEYESIRTAEADGDYRDPDEDN